jgi:WD40 repeat protein
LLRQLWSTKLGSGCIDASICAKSATIAVADISRGIVITDLLGNVIVEHHVPFPAWGIDHRIGKDGRLLIAAASASKNPSAGHVGIFLDDERVVDHLFDAPAWDVIILEDFSVVSSSWNGNVLIWGSDLKEPPTAIEVHPNKPIFGLERDNVRGGFYANVERDGLYHISGETRTTSRLAELKTNSYNMSVSNDGGLIATGGYGPSVSLFHTSNGKIVRFPGTEVRAVAFVDGLLFLGDSEGLVTGWSTTGADSPLLSFKLEADVWAAAYSPQLNILAVASGDGRLTCFEPIFDPNRLLVIEEKG